MRGKWIESELLGDKKGNLVLRVGKKMKFQCQIEQCEALPGRNRDLVLLCVQGRWVLLQTSEEADA